MKDECKLRPMSGKMVVLKDKEAEKTKGGIYIPETARDKKGVPLWGTVVAVGSGAQTATAIGNVEAIVEVSVGDKVCFSSFAGFEIEQPDGRKYQVMGQDEVYAVLITEEGKK